jgi:type VI secretion system protein ImpA
MFNVEQLLKPVSANAACGEDLAFSAELDAIAQARKADDPSIEQGAWVTTLKEADWKFVTKRCALLLETRSKDLQLAVWLAEAAAKTAGLRGLGDALQAVAGLCDRYWDGLYPQPDEGGFEQRIGNLCWIAARVPQLVRECAAGAGGAPESDCKACLAAVDALEQAVDARLGVDGPGFSAARTALQNVVHVVTPASPGAVVALAPGAPAAAQPVAGPVQAIVNGAIGTRAQALAQLRTVADYFRQTEPHSPVAYLADKAAAWGEQPLHLWLKAVVKDAGALAHVEELLGIERDVPEG